MSKHYRILIIGSFKPLKGNQTWETYEDLKLAGHAVEVLDPCRHANLFVEDGSPDPSVLAPIVKTFNPDYIAFRNETANEILTEINTANANGAIDQAKYSIQQEYK